MPRLARLRFPVAVVLLVAAIAIPLFDAGESTYRYERNRITVDDGRIGFETPYGSAHDLDEIDCVGIVTSWDCLANRAMVDGGPTVGSDHPPTAGGSTFVLVDGRPYRRSLIETDYGTRLSLEAVAPRTVLEAVAVPAEQVSRPARRAAETGSTTASHRLREEHGVVEYEGSYYVLRRNGGSRGTDAPRLVQGFLSVVLGGFAVALLTDMRTIR